MKQWYYNPFEDRWTSEGPYGVKEYTVSLEEYDATVVVVPFEKTVKKKDGKYEVRVDFVPVGIRMEEVKSREKHNNFTLPGKMYFFQYGKEKVSETAPWLVLRDRANGVLGGAWPEPVKPKKVKGVPVEQHFFANLFTRLIALAKAQYAAYVEEKRAAARAA